MKRIKYRPISLQMLQTCITAIFLMHASAMTVQANAQENTNTNTSNISNTSYTPAPSAHTTTDHQQPPTRELAIIKDGKDGPERDGPVVVIPVRETIELGLSAFVIRALHEHPDAVAFVLDINTFGGRVDAAVQIRDALLESDTPTIAYIHPRAISAGALVSLACDFIYIAPGASIGAATPFSQGGSETSAGTGNVEVDEKMVSYMRTEMRTTAEATKRRGDIAEAMVDRDVTIPDISPAGKVLTLDTERALALYIADAEAASLDDMLSQAGLSEQPRVFTNVNWAETLARFLTDPAVSGLLLSLGMLALMISLYTQTFGVITGIGLSALFAFFFGHAIVHLAGMEEIAIFAVGLLLLAIELFVTPGFGAAGIVGLVCVITSLTLSLVALPIDVSFQLGGLTTAVARTLTSILGSVVLGAIALRFLPSTTFGKQLVLNTTLSSPTLGTNPQTNLLVGQQATTLSHLRPSGRIQLGNGQRYDAQSERAYIDKNTRVQIFEVRGGIAMVRLTNMGEHEVNMISEQS